IGASGEEVARWSCVREGLCSLRHPRASLRSSTRTASYSHTTRMGGPDAPRRSTPPRVRCSLSDVVSVRIVKTVVVASDVPALVGKQLDREALLDQIARLFQVWRNDAV